MKKILALLLAITVAFTGCGSDDADGATATSSTTKTLYSIEITANNVDIAPSATKQFAAVGTFSDGTTLPLVTGLTWTSSEESVAVVSSTGLVTGVAAGTTYITATSGSTNSNTDAVTVSDKNVTAISVTPNDQNISKDDSQQYIAQATYDDGSTSVVTTSVTWDTNDSSVATINSLGICTPVTSGTVSIIATLSTFSGSGEANLTINNQVLSDVAILYSGFDIRIGQSQPMTAQATYVDADTNTSSTSVLSTGVTWTSSNTAVATVSTLGEVTGVSAGSATITASYDGFSDTQAVTITTDTLTDFEVTPTDLNVSKGRTGTVRALATYTDETNTSVTLPVTNDTTWTTSNIAIATVATDGTVTGIGAGTATITGTYQGNTGTSTVVVEDKSAQSITVSPSTTTITMDDIVRLEANATYADGSKEDITGSALWTTSDELVATVTNGIVTPVSAGTVTIMAAADDVNGTATVTVSTVSLTSVAITPDAPSIASDGIVQLTLTGTYSDASESNLTNVDWMTDNNLTTISAAGGLVQAQGTAGTSTITASYTDSNNTIHTDTTVVTITAAALNNIIISVAGGDNTISIDETDTLSAEGNYSDGMTSTLVALDDVIWGTSDRNTSTVVFNTGEITGVAAGDVNFTVNHTSGVSETITITVAP
jgi:trimeric autotransporter adhesin